MSLSTESIVVASSAQVSSELQDESVILDVQSGTYYGLNDVGASIWTLIQEPKAIANVQASIMAEYEVSAEQCEQDILTLLEQLIEIGLVNIYDEVHP